MKLQELDRAMNELMEKYDWHDTSEEEDAFLINLTKDLVQLLQEHDVSIFEDN